MAKIDDTFSAGDDSNLLHAFSEEQIITRTRMSNLFTTNYGISRTNMFKVKYVIGEGKVSQTSQLAVNYSVRILEKEANYVKRDEKSASSRM